MLITEETVTTDRRKGSTHSINENNIYIFLFLRDLDFTTDRQNMLHFQHHHMFGHQKCLMMFGWQTFRLDH